MNEKKILVEDVPSNLLGFRVHWSYDDYGANVDVWELSARNDAGTAFFEAKDAQSGLDVVENHEEAKRYLTGRIKWDGCSEFTFNPDEDVESHFHWCGPTYYRNHFFILEYLYKRAQELITKGNWKPWDRNA